MNMTWDLDTIYPSFDSPKLSADRELLDQHSKALNQWTKCKLANTQGPAAAIEAFLRLYNQYKSIYVCLLAYAELILSADSDHMDAMNLADDMEQMNAEIAGTVASFKLWLAGCENVDEFIRSSPYLLEHRFYLQELLAQSRHVLSEEVEEAIANMQSTGSKAWERLYMERASNVRTVISIEGESREVALSELRSMAYESKAELRLAAYIAEIEACQQIAPVCAASINSISGEALSIYGMRGYSSSLEKVLEASRMDSETLAAMLSALKESLPSFHAYYRKKAELLGHQDALPFYDIFAPIGEETVPATYTEAKDIIISGFATFSGELAEFAEKVFDQRWIDAEPRAGKAGYGLCIDIFPIHESRIMTSFTGTSLDISVLAHEIGHAYHSSCLSHETMLNTDYPIPIAETASIFCETLVNQVLISNASGKEALPILERSISDAGYYLVDFYARYLFELQLFTRRASGPLTVQELNELMHSCMIEAYGESIDETTFHAYMWMNKAGYFMAGNEFLNFPYSFGLLFSKGLYAEYLKRGEEFVTQYRLFLSATSKNNIVDAAGMMGVDVHSIDFWRNALQLIKTDIAEFISRV